VIEYYEEKLNRCKDVAEDSQDQEYQLLRRPLCSPYLSIAVKTPVRPYELLARLMNEVLYCGTEAG